MPAVAEQLDRLLTLSASHRYEEAEPGARALLKDWPQCGAAFKVLGFALQQRGHDPEAVVVLQRAAALLEADGALWAALGLSLYGCGLHRDAVLAVQRAVGLDPANGPAHNTLGLALKAMGRLTEAEASFRNAIAVHPGLVEARLNLGPLLQGRGEFAGAERCLRDAVDLKPDLHHAHHDLGRYLLDVAAKVTEAEQCFRRAVALNPGSASAHNNLGNALLQQGKPAEAEAAYRRALSLAADPRVFSNLLFCLAHNPEVGPERLHAEHVAFARTFEAPLLNAWPAPDNARDPDKRLRVGMVSGDLRGHALSCFLEPLLEALAGRPGMEIQLYSTVPVEDETSARLRALVSGWCVAGHLSDEALAQKIQSDGVDVLIDLSGHTSLNRLMVFARKPAPVQASWMGYPGTTGLQAMDYYLADSQFLPREQFEVQFTEKIVHLPAVAPFRAFSDAPDPGPLPALSNGHITFGSFNRRSKIGRAEIRAWSALLRAVPKSRLLIGGLPRELEQPELVGGLLAEGVSPDRLRLFGRCGTEEYLKLHQEVDICLDTLTYGGGTTTMLALWMGVPTLTVAGATPPSRSGASILLGVDLEAFVARDEMEFVHRGAALAEDKAHLAELRRGMRERFHRSARGQPDHVASGFEEALRTMWRRWCAGLPPEAFGVSSGTR